MCERPSTLSSTRLANENLAWRNHVSRRRSFCNLHHLGPGASVKERIGTVTPFQNSTFRSVDPPEQCDQILGENDAFLRQRSAAALG